MSHELSTAPGKDLHEFSASRLRLAQKCGLAFKYHYVDKLPAPYDRATSIFGTVLHRGLQDWYGGAGPIATDNLEHHKETDLASYVQAQWESVLPPAVHDGLFGLLELDKEQQAVAQAIHIKRPKLKNPHGTQDYLTSAAHKQFLDASEKLEELCAKEYTEKEQEDDDRNRQIKWPQNEGPLKAYLTSLAIARRLQNEWGPLPRPLLVEQPFVLEYEGWTLHGTIDQLRKDHPKREAEVEDCKTVKQPLSQMDAFLQAYLYYEAVKGMDFVPTTTKIAFSLLRYVDDFGKTRTQRGRIDPERHKALALRILHANTRRVLTAQFDPSYGFWCKNCDFFDLCSDEISMWEGDGIVGGKEET